jgi:Tfp pilus assembly protein PilN
MTQQINLYNPILLAPRRYFSARAMVQALGLVTLVLVLVCVWLQASTVALRRDRLASARAQDSERERLTQALAASPAASGAALEQELAHLQQVVTQRRLLLDELSRGRVVEGRSHSAMLRLIAQTVPAPVWLTDIRLVEGRIELSGMTVQTEALRPWLSRLAGDPLTAGQHLATVKVERATAGAANGVPAGVDTWSFQLVSSVAAARPGAANPGGPP